MLVYFAPNYWMMMKTYSITWTLNYSGVLAQILSDVRFGEGMWKNQH